MFKDGSTREQGLELGEGVIGLWGPLKVDIGGGQTSQWSGDFTVIPDEAAVKIGEAQETFAPFGSWEAASRRQLLS